jgi:hypothetical protein
MFFRKNDKIYILQNFLKQIIFYDIILINKKGEEDYEKITS